MESKVQLGIACSLLSPVAWSFAVILFRRSGDHVSPVALNLFKNIVASACFGLLLLIVGEGAPEGTQLMHYGILIASGLIGVGLADLFFLMCLNRIGAGRQAIVNTAYSPPIIFLSAVFLGERMTAWQLLGVAMILTAVLLVGLAKGSATASKETVRAGVMYGIAACMAQAVSIVIVKPYLAEWPLIWTTHWRMLGGLAATGLMAYYAKPEHRRLSGLMTKQAMKFVLPATLLGSCVSLLLWMAGFKFADASVSAALGQTSTLYTFVLAVIFLGEPVTPRRVIGLICGMAGVALVTFLG